MLLNKKSVLLTCTTDRHLSQILAHALPLMIALHKMQAIDKRGSNGWDIHEFWAINTCIYVYLYGYAYIWTKYI